MPPAPANIVYRKSGLDEVAREAVEVERFVVPYTLKDGAHLRIAERLMVGVKYVRQHRNNRYRCFAFFVFVG